jgi:protein involved in polysaccharide export with SLBB domain
VSLDQLLVKQDKPADVALQADDQIYVFSKSSIDPLNVVSISGQIVNPGQYPYAEKMRLVDLIFAAGGPNEEAYLKVAELTRYEVIEGKRQGRHVEVNLADALAGNADANMVLLPHDELLIRTISNWRSATRVTIKGEVKYPGLYPVEEGERLSNVLVRAGGYTDEAYLRAAVFTRESVRADQQKQIDELAQRTEAEVAKLETSVDTLKDEMLRARQLGKLEAAKRVVAQIKAVRSTGRIVIELADAEKLKGTPFDLAMRDGDRLYVPKRPDEVMVLGEVYNQAAFVYRNNISGAEYLAMAGGATRSGDVYRTYVVRANGMLDVVNKGWFGGQSISMEPGDAIVIPQEVEQFNLVDSTLDWSRVMMQVGVSLASMKTIGIFK